MLIARQKARSEKKACDVGDDGIAAGGGLQHAVIGTSRLKLPP